MPLFDADDYSQENSSYILGLMAAELDAAGRSMSGHSFHYLNIAFGVRLLGFDSADGRFHVCRQKDYGAIAVLFHQVSADCFRKSVPAEFSTLVTCVTVVWLCSELTAEMLRDGFDMVEDIAQTMELCSGKPCLVPNLEGYIPDPLEIARWDPTERQITRHLIRVEKKPVPAITLKVAQMIAAADHLDKKASLAGSPSPEQIFSHASFWQRKAINAFGVNDHQLAVIASQTWVETFLVQITLELNRLMDTPIADPKSQVMRGLAQFINQHLGSKFLKGRWDQTDASTEFGCWYQQCCLLRNEVIHLGKYPSRAESTAAYDAAHEFIWFVTAKLAQIKDAKARSVASVCRSMAEFRGKPYKEFIR